MKIVVEYDSLSEFLAFGNLASKPVTPPPAPTPAPVLTPVPAPIPAPVPVPAPAPTQAPNPQIRMLNMPARSIPGALRWTNAGVTYMAAVVTNGDIIIAGLYSAAGTNEGLQMARLEQMLDSGLDTRPPGASS